jgi:DNA-binding transcriptional regulator YdaS (Cro superfamily)
MEAKPKSKQRQKEKPETDPNPAVVKATSLFGSHEALAQQIGSTQGFVWQWANGTRPVPHEMCTAIECVTGGQVTCEELRPDARWGRVPDPKWPWHPKGRPVVEVKHNVCAAVDMPAQSKGDRQ